MCYGNEVRRGFIHVDKQTMTIVAFCFQRFTQYLASSNSNFQLANFLDKTGVQGG